MKRWLLPLAAFLVLAAVLLPRPYEGRQVPAGNLPPLLTTPASARPGVEAPLNLNTATLEELQTLPEIGPQRAQSILDYRAQNGPFQSVEELAAVEGIGMGLLEQVRQSVCINP